MNTEMTLKLIEALAQLLGVVATIVVALKYTNTKVLGQSLADLNSEVQRAVAAEYQRSVKDLKDPSKPGSWTNDQKIAARRAVMNVVFSGAGPIIARLRAQGMDDGAVRGTISDMIEAAVLSMKNQQNISVTAVERASQPGGAS